MRWRWLVLPFVLALYALGTWYIRGVLRPGH
jgi:hypothetical protein